MNVYEYTSTESVYVYLFIYIYMTIWRTHPAGRISLLQPAFSECVGLFRLRSPSHTHPHANPYRARRSRQRKARLADLVARQWGGIRSSASLGDTCARPMVHQGGHRDWHGAWLSSNDVLLTRKRVGLSTADDCRVSGRRRMNDAKAVGALERALERGRITWSVSCPRRDPGRRPGVAGDRSVDRSPLLYCGYLETASSAPASSARMKETRDLV